MKPRPKHRFKAEHILHAMKEAGGMRLSEIQRLIWSINHPDVPFDPKAQRGYYCTVLYGSRHRFGLLEWFCTPLPDGRWVVSEEIKRPYYPTSKKDMKTTKSFEWQKDLRRGRRQREEEAKPICPSCKQRITQWGNQPMWSPLPDRGQKTHLCRFSHWYVIDCQDRIFFREGPKNWDLKLTDIRGTAEIMHIYGEMRANHGPVYTDEQMMDYIKRRIKCS